MTPPLHSLITTNGEARSQREFASTPWVCVGIADLDIAAGRRYHLLVVQPCGRSPRAYMLLETATKHSH